MGLLKYLNEADKTPVDIKWVKENNEMHGEFLIEDQIFTIEVTKLENTYVPDIYQFKFYRGSNRTEIFNDIKYVYKVIPTIKQAFDYVISTLHPSILLFATIDNSSMRKKLYSLEAEIISNKYKYKNISKSDTLKKMGYDTNVLVGIYKNEDILDLALKEIG